MESTLTDFEKFHPPQKKSILHVYWFLRFFPPSTTRLLKLCISFFHKIPPSTFIPTSTFIDFATFALPPRLFQPPRLLERWEYTRHKAAQYKVFWILVCFNLLFFVFSFVFKEVGNDCSWPDCYFCEACFDNLKSFGHQGPLTSE